MSHATLIESAFNFDYSVCGRVSAERVAYDVRNSAHDRRFKLFFRAMSVGGKCGIPSAIVEYAGRRYYVDFISSENRYHVVHA